MYAFEQSAQLRLFLLSLGAGFLLGILYDFLRAVRLSLFRGKAAVLVFDVLYFFLFGVLSFLFLLSVNKGEIRFYLLFGELLGALLYYFTFGMAAIRLTDAFVRLFRFLLKWLIRGICAPFRLVFRGLRGIFRGLRRLFQKFFKKINKNCKKDLPKRKQCVYNLVAVILPKCRKMKTEGEAEVAQAKKKKKKSVSITVAVICILFVAYFAYNFITMQLEINRKKAELSTLQTQLASQQVENSELESAVNDKDEKSLVERAARENGYIYPGERVYRDVTPTTGK